MKLREALDLCSGGNAHDWVEVPGPWGRPATAMLAGMFDPGMSDSIPRPLMGHSLAVYEPDPRLSVVWPVPEDDEPRDLRGDAQPEWAQDDPHTWKVARHGWTVILLNGAPIWQVPMYYLDWGSGIGGYVAHFSPVFGGEHEELAGGRAPKIERWDALAWEIGLADLINSFSHTARDFANVDPTRRVAPTPSQVHPIEQARGD